MPRDARPEARRADVTPDAKRVLLAVRRGLPISGEDAAKLCELRLAGLVAELFIPVRPDRTGFRRAGAGRVVNVLTAAGHAALSFAAQEKGGGEDDDGRL